MQEEVLQAVGDSLREYLCNQNYNYPRLINGGSCAKFADEVAANLPSDTDWKVLALPGHTWITSGGRHYDAEAPSGVEDWRDLPFWRRGEPLTDDEPKVMYSSGPHPVERTGS